MPNVQWKTPDDGQRNCPKHVEFRTRINLEISASVRFIVKKIVTMHGHVNVKYTVLLGSRQFMPESYFKLVVLHSENVSVL